MKKSLLAIVLLWILAVLSSCGGSTDMPENKNTFKVYLYDGFNKDPVKVYDVLPNTVFDFPILGDKDHYTFKGWVNVDTGREIQGKIPLKYSENGYKFKAIWEHWPYLVEFRNDGSTISSVRYASEDTLSFPNPLSEDGKTFGGWLREGETKRYNKTAGSDTYTLEKTEENTKVIFNATWEDNANATIFDIDENGYIYGIDKTVEAPVIPAALYSVPVKGIKDEGFKNYTSLKSIKFPEEMSEIGASAFQGCSALKGIDLANVKTIGNSAFIQCTALENITWSECLTTIGQSAFQRCSKLSGIIIPDSVTEVGSFAFADCLSLEYFSFSTKMETIPYEILSNCESLTNVTIPDSIQTIKEYAFKGCIALEKITFGKGISNIGKAAFYDCALLNNVTIPAQVKSIEDETFSSCTNLSVITLEEGVESLGSKVFLNCSSLKSIIIPKSLNTISDDAFSSCNELDVLIKLKGDIYIPFAELFDNYQIWSEDVKSVGWTID